MLPAFLLPEIELRESGSGQSFDLGTPESRPDQVLITLGITHTIEQESLNVVIQGSEDGVKWWTKPLLSFSQKFYCGTYQMLLDLKCQARLRYVRPKWTLNRWGKGDLNPIFEAYLFLQEQRAMAIGKGAG